METLPVMCSLLKPLMFCRSGWTPSGSTFMTRVSGNTCDKLMEIEVLSPRKPQLFLTKQADSVYNDLSIGSPGKFESFTDIIHNKIEETDGRFLIGQEEDTEPPHWAALFEGSRPMVVQKTVLSPGKESNQSITSPVTASKKKRRAPPPPPDKLPFVQPTSLFSSQEKENCKAARPRTEQPSLDAKFSAIIQQLQKSHTSTRKMHPLDRSSPVSTLGFLRKEMTSQIYLKILGKNTVRPLRHLCRSPGTN